MRKWLAITVLVLAGFTAILLGLGYLLNENEKSTTVLKAQLEQASQAEKVRQERIRQRKTIADDTQQLVKNSKPKSITDIAENIRVLGQFEQIVVSNLTCISVQQCQVAKVSFNNTDCSVAINNIGAFLLKKLETQSTMIAICPKSSPQVLLSCQQNICAFQR
jgi:hypothetical protein